MHRIDVWEVLTSLSKCRSCTCCHELWGWAITDINFMLMFHCLLYECIVCINQQSVIIKMYLKFFLRVSDSSSCLVKL